MNNETIFSHQFERATDYLMVKFPFISYVLVKLDSALDETIDTAYTDGKRIVFNPEFFNSLSDLEQVTLIAHEVLHCAFLHFLRLEGRDIKLANVAMDHAINLILVEMGFAPLRGWLCDEQYKGMEWELIYTKLLQQPTPQQEEQKQKAEASAGHVSQPTNEDGSELSEDQKAEAEDATIKQFQQAINHQQRMVNAIKNNDKLSERQKKEQLRAVGKGFETIVKTFEDVLTSKINWLEVIHHFLNEKCMNDFSFMYRDRRIEDFYIPGLYSENFGDLTMVLDVSASMYDISKQVASEAFECLRQMEDSEDPKLHLIYASAGVDAEETVTDESQIKLIEGFGTAFTPVFEHLQQCETKGILFVTDGVVEDMDGWIEPPCPVLWVLVDKYVRFSPPFGEVLYVSL